MTDDTIDDNTRENSSVGRALIKITHALGFGLSGKDSTPLFVDEKENVTLNWNFVVSSLHSDSLQQKCLLLESLQNKIAVLGQSDRLKLLDIVLNNIDLSKICKLRTQSLFLIIRILELEKHIDERMLAMIYRKIYLGFKSHTTDPDLNYFLDCLNELLRLTKPASLVQYNNIDDMLFAIVNEAYEMQNYQMIRSVCNVIARTLHANNKLLTIGTLEGVFDKLIAINDSEALTVERLCAFNLFFAEFMKIDDVYKTRILSVLSTIGHGFIAKDILIKEQSQKILQTLIETDINETIYGICDVIDCKTDPNVTCLKKLKLDIIGCIRLLLCLGKEMFGTFKEQEQQEIKLFFNKGAPYLMRCLLNATKLKDSDVSKEIVKYFVQILETPYIINNNYKAMVEQSLFWDILKGLYLDNTCEIHNIGFLTIQTELFNKLQSLKLDDYSQRQLFEYLELNSDHLSLYNIEYVLQYYEDTNMCVCGMLNWKENCTRMIQEYYAISPYRVIEILKKAYFYCVSLKVQNESIQFYIDCICYRCVINLPIKLKDDICEPLSAVIMSLDIPNFEKLINDYKLEVEKQEDINLILMVKTVTVCALKSIDECIVLKRKILLKESLNLAFSTQNFESQHLFLFPIMLLLNLRVVKNGTQKLYYIKGLASYNLKITKLNGNTSNRSSEYHRIDKYLDKMIRERLYNSLFDSLVEKYFKNGKTVMFEEDLKLRKVLNLYICILKNTTKLENYLLVLLHLKEQMLNLSLFDERCEEPVREIVELLCSQMQNIYEFKFAYPDWFQVEHLRAMIVSTLYGFIPYKNWIQEHTRESLIRTIILDFHFSSITTDAYVNFINCCLYELPNTMKHFIHPIMKVIVSDSKKPETHFAGLEFVYNILNLKAFYTLDNEETDLVKNYLSNVYYFKGESSDYKRVCENLCLLICEENNIKDVSFSEPSVKINVNLKIEVDSNDEYLKSFSDTIRELFDTPIVDDASGEILLTITDSESLGCGNGKQIVIRKVSQESKFYNVASFGFSFINIRDVIIDAVNIERYTENLIKISSMCTKSIE